MLRFELHESIICDFTGENKTPEKIEMMKKTAGMDMEDGFFISLSLSLNSLRASVCLFLEREGWWWWCR